MNNLSVNEGALKITKQIVDRPDYYSIEVSKLSNKATIIDGSHGSYEFGRLVSEICMGGLGRCQFTDISVKEVFIPGLFVYTSHPVIALIGSQKADQISIQGEGQKKYNYMVSGPFRAKTRLDKELFNQINYSDESKETVIVFESDMIKDESLLERVFSKCKLEPANTIAIFTPTNSIPGTVQIAARVIKTGIHILREQNFNPHYLKHAMGTTTLAPIAKNLAQAMGRTNDSIIYGGKVFLTVDIPEEEESQMVELLEECPSSVSSSYGKPFYDILREVEFDFSKVDGKLFAPAVLTINNMSTGNTFTAGEVNEDILLRSYF
ncbi:MAG: methenyltetrahydromethanopterin cyclohydrolase [Promethearchaeia archaeon]